MKIKYFNLTLKKILLNTVLLTISNRNRTLVNAHVNPCSPGNFVLIIKRPGRSYTGSVNYVAKVQDILNSIEFFTDSALWARSVIESPCPSVCLSVTSQNTHFRRSWRPLVKECIPIIGL